MYNKLILMKVGFHPWSQMQLLQLLVSMYKMGLGHRMKALQIMKMFWGMAGLPSNSKGKLWIRMS
jgi:hypothetical protein